MDQESLSHKTLRNSAYYFVGYILPILFGIVVTPFVVHRLGVVEYGILVLVNTVTSFLGYIDLGLGSAFTKYASEYQARKDFGSLSKLLGSVQSLSYIYGAVGFLVFVIIGKWLLPLFHIPTQSLNHIFLVFVLGGALFLINSMNGVALGVATALQRFDLITKINIASLIFINLFTVLAVLVGYQIKAIMAINVLGSGLVFLAYRLIQRRLLREVPPHFAWHPGEIKKAYRFGLLSFVSSFSAGALVFLDRLIIPIFINPAQLSYYSLPGNVALKTPGITNSLSVMLFPMASAFQGAGEGDRMRQIYVRVFRNLSIVAAGITTGIILFARPILLFWLGPEFADRGTIILIILAVTNYLVSIYIPLQSMLLGLGELKFLIWQSVGMALLNFILLLILVPRMGIVGAAWAYLIAILPMTYAFYWVEHKLFGFTSQLTYYLKFYFGLLVTAVITAILAKFAILPFVSTIYTLIILGPLTVVFYFVFYYLFGFANKSDIAIFKNFLFRIFKLKLR